MQQTEKKSIHVDYRVRTKDTDSVNALEIETPLWVLVIAYKFTSTEFYQLLQSLQDKFQYSETEIVPLELPNHSFDFIMITKDTSNTRTFGRSESSNDDGHELEIAQAVVDFYDNMNLEDNDNVRGTGQIYSGQEYYDSTLFQYTNEYPDEFKVSIDIPELIDVSINLNTLLIKFRMLEEDEDN